MEKILPYDWLPIMVIKIYLVMKNQNRWKSIKERITKELTEVENTKEEWETMHIEERKTNITEIVKIVSYRIKDLRLFY